MLAANTAFEFRTGLTTHFHCVFDKLADAFLVKVVSGTAFVGLGANSARLRVPAEEHRELVFRAIDAIDRGEPGPGAQ